MAVISEIPDLTPNEVAVLAEVSPRAVRKAIEDRVLAVGELRWSAFHRAKRKALGASAVEYMAVMSEIDWPIPVEGRVRIARFLRETSPKELRGQLTMSGPLTLNIDRFAAKVRRVAKRTSDYRRARDAWIRSNPAVMGGTPVIKGTRITVYSVLGRVEADESLDAVAKENPDIPRKAFEAAVIFARANPVRGRPSGRPWTRMA